jgi:hypothetical protein
MFADVNSRLFAAVAVSLLLFAGQSFAQAPAAKPPENSTPAHQMPGDRASAPPPAVRPTPSPVTSISSITVGDYARFQAEKMQREMGLATSVPSSTTATMTTTSSKAPPHPLEYLTLNGVAGPVQGPYVAELRSLGGYSYLSEGDELPMLPGWRLATVAPDSVRVVNRACVKPAGLQSAGSAEGTTRRVRARGAETICSKTLQLSRPSLTH